MFVKPLIAILKAVLWLLDSDHRQPHEIAANDMKKFTHVQEQQFVSDFGTVQRVFRTVPYNAWVLITDSKRLIAADKHRVIRDDHTCAWIEDLQVGDRIKTDQGIEVVRQVRDLGVRTHMYCVEVKTADPNDVYNHLYYTDGILSHNTTCAAGYLLWRSMFVPDTCILVTANKYLQALEIMDRIRYAYENLPNHIRAGVNEYNKGSITFDNGSKIVARATSADAGRGLSVTLLYCLAGESMVKIRNKQTGLIEDISLRDLHARLAKAADET